MKTLQSLKIAIVYDWFDSWGGIERILLILAEMFPNAGWYTSIFDKKRAHWAKPLKPKTSFIQRLPEFIKNNRVLSVPLYPLAFESFDFSGFDLVLTISSSFAKGIITRPKTLHINYLLAPTRFLWPCDNIYSTSGVGKIITKPLFDHLRHWDKIASSRPDKIVSISKTVAKRVSKYYHRDSTVIYPPFNIEYWSQLKSEILNPKFQFLNSNFYLIVSRLEPYKKIDLAIETFNQTDDRLVIVGSGSQSSRLRRKAKSNITFLEKISDNDLAYLYSKAQALIMPQDEDFGLVSLEAQYFGCPVIAYGHGGATETVIDRKTGLFFDEPTINSLLKTIEKFDTISDDFKKSIKILGLKNVSRFNKDNFKKQFLNFMKNNL